MLKSQLFRAKLFERNLCDSGSLFLYITPSLKEKLNLKTIVSRHVTMKVFGNPIFQEKLDLIDLNLKCTENKEILIESKVWVSFI